MSIVNLMKKPLLKWNNIFSLSYISKRNYYNISTLSNLNKYNKRNILTSRENSHFNKCNRNLFEEELNNIFKQYPVSEEKSEKNEEILITSKNNGDKKIGDVIKLDNYIYGVVLQINKSSIIIGKIYEREQKNTNEKCIEVQKKNIYSPFEYLNSLFPNSNKLNIFNSNNKEVYKKVVKKQLYSDILLIDFFNKIKFGQKVCVIGEKDFGKKKILISVMYENLLVNTIKKNENFFILCSNSYKSEIMNIFCDLNELFKNTYKNKKEGNNRDTENIIEQIYSKNYIYENIKIPNDVLLINSTPNNDSKVSSYILPILSLYNLNEYKKKFKNVILVFYDINNYHKILLDLQNDMNTFIKNYYHKNEEINKSKSLCIASLPFSIQTILSKYFSSSSYPYYTQKDEDLQEQDNINNSKYSLENFKYSDLINIIEHKNYNTSNSVTTFCFFDNDEEINQIKNYALSLSENNVYLLKNNLNIYPEININYFIKNEIAESNKIWKAIKDEIRNIFDKRNELLTLIENKKMMKIYVDHWEYEDFIHYNNIYYILIYKSFKIFNLNSFENLVFLRNLLIYNFTNEVISQKSVESYYEQFFNYYFQNFKYFSFLYSEYYKNLKSFRQTKYAIIFLNKIDKVIKNIKPSFNYVL
ncbi:conserved Plasmodium protein, unknown function [Plasmodium relictum]|uniref:Uncharacterized protein n=1 Tax=Plasmodium relictum TaxID=85471 RepID=A0A1J1HE57_PLARL|nr:conserved Plasmodium protein, unknown function [Plasmodium relictum]CRH01702.1 conserved Plasmodium protein, unknown function [Plasmodium relictum]